MHGLARNGCLGEQRTHDIQVRDTFQCGFGGEHEAVRHHRRCHLLHIIGCHKVPAAQACAHACGFQQALLSAAGVTAVEVLLGFLFSAVVGIAVALVIVRFAAFGRALYPLVVLFQTVPKVALAPIFILWFGYDLLPKVTLIVVIAFFPVALNMLVGLQSIDPALVALMRSVGAGRTEILRRVQIPNSLPYLISGLKIAITFSVIGAVVGEFAGASAGLGYMIEFASTQLETPLVFAALFEVSVLGVAFYYVIEALEHRFVAWAPRYDQALAVAAAGGRT
jgi:NitT/TauT family transport system permease protein